jgi:radical SAM/Cys-rich protein
MISAETRERFIAWINLHRPSTVDITGGAPEIIPGFREIVIAARACGARVIDRCNLVVLDEPEQTDLAQFLSQHQVMVVASMPCYLKDNVDAQRGKGTYDRSIAGLQKLNSYGYGQKSELPLNLVYNPGGIGLPPRESELESSYRERLKADWNIDFTTLWCLANVPITRWRRHLERINKLHAYEERLEQAYNPATLDGLMCKSTLSVDYQGRLYDCDFNQALGLHLGGKAPRFLWEITPNDVSHGDIAMGRHCLACTAGCGSSCSGAVRRD